jgi:hypothetical protein
MPVFFSLITIMPLLDCIIVNMVQINKKSGFRKRKNLTFPP